MKKIAYAVAAVVSVALMAIASPSAMAITTALGGMAI
jgi:hypothetical protein